MMKKLWMIMFALVLTVCAGARVRAGVFDGYWDFEQSDGTYAYGFPRVLVTMDKTWYQNTRVVLGEEGRTASFYHTDSYNAYAAEGLDGGRLFTLGASVNTDFQKLPHFIYIDFDEEEAMNYYADLPTDYQAYTGDAAIRAEYDELWSQVEDVIADILVKGSEKYRELHEEKPPVHIPQAGEYLYQALNDEKLANIKEEPPVELSFHVDLGGYGRTAVFKEKSALDQAVSLLCGIKIGEESGEWVTDNYNWIRLTWEDGTGTFISLNLNNLEYFTESVPRTWRLEDLDKFWSYASGYLEEDYRGDNGKKP